MAEEQKTVESVDKKFHKLTPYDDIEMGIYEEALNYAFSQNDIQNIAISGAYGDG